MPLATGERVPVSGYSVTDAQAENFGLPPAPWSTPATDDAAEDGEFAALAQIGPSPGLEPGENVPVRVPTRKGDISLPLSRADKAPGKLSLVPLPLAAMLRTTRDRRVLYSAEEGPLLLGRPGYRGFRIYARSIDGVPGLVDDLRDQGVPTLAKVQEILGL